MSIPSGNNREYASGTGGGTLSVEAMEHYLQALDEAREESEKEDKELNTGKSITKSSDPVHFKMHPKIAPSREREKATHARSAGAQSSQPFAVKGKTSIKIAKPKEQDKDLKPAVSPSGPDDAKAKTTNTKPHKVSGTSSRITKSKIDEEEFVLMSRFTAEEYERKATIFGGLNEDGEEDWYVV